MHLKLFRAAAFFFRPCRMVCACRSRRCGGKNWANSPAFSLAPARVVPTGSAGGASPAWLTWDNEDNCGARAQGRPSNRKSEHHPRVHRAAAPVPCAAVRAWWQQKRSGRAGHVPFGTADYIFGFSFIQKALTFCRSVRSQARQSQTRI